MEIWSENEMQVWNAVLTKTQLLKRDQSKNNYWNGIMTQECWGVLDKKKKSLIIFYTFETLDSLWHCVFAI